MSSSFVDDEDTAKLNALRFVHASSALLKGEKRAIGSNILGQISSGSRHIQTSTAAGNDELVEIDKLLEKRKQEQHVRRREAVDEERNRQYQQQQLEQQQEKEEHAMIEEEEEKEKPITSRDKMHFPHLKNNDDDATTTSGVRIQMLLQQQKDLSAQELEAERVNHNILSAEAAELTGVLKEATLLMRESVLEQNVNLDSIHLQAQENMAELDEQNKKIKERTKNMRNSVVSTFGSYIWIVSLFVLTYAIIRIFPRYTNTSSSV